MSCRFLILPPSQTTTNGFESTIQQNRFGSSHVVGEKPFAVAGKGENEGLALHDDDSDTGKC